MNPQENAMSMSGDAVKGGGGGGGSGSGFAEIMLFGVRVKVDPMRKSVSMNNLSEYEPVGDTCNRNEKSGAAAEGDGAAGYASADDAVPPPSGGTGERKRGVPWTEEEHKLFLFGLQKVGKGDWRGISRNHVKTRTPTQVASHAQKYFLRLSNTKSRRRRRRASLFDMTTASITEPMEEGKNHEDISAQPAAQPASPPLPATSNMNLLSIVPFPVTLTTVPLPMPGGNFIENSGLNQRVQVPACTSSKKASLNLKEEVPPEPSPLSLRLSLSTGHDQSSIRDSAFKVIPSFKMEIAS